jgi:predicted dehydrogenase
VLADKPWIIEPADLPKLQAALDAAGQKGVVAFDAMTQRFEITCIVARELVNDRDVFGTCLPGSAAEPTVRMESVHYLLKEVAGTPMLRPPWFFDIRQQGEGLTDVGTHLVDLVQWTLFPEQAIDYHSEVQVLHGTRWPTLLTRPQFQRVTGEREFPVGLREAVKEDRLEYFANNRVDYTIRRVRTQLDIRWNFEAPPGGADTESTVFRGSKSRIEVRQGVDEEFRPEVYVVPNDSGQKTELQTALTRKIEELQATYPGLAVQEQTGRFRVTIPQRYRIGHKAHFALLTRRFLDYVRNPATLPAWEKPNMLAKYYVTTRGIELARENSGKPTSAKTNNP